MFLCGPGLRCRDFDAVYWIDAGMVLEVYHLVYACVARSRSQVLISFLRDFRRDCHWSQPSCCPRSVASVIYSCLMTCRNRCHHHWHRAQVRKAVSCVDSKYEIQLHFGPYHRASSSCFGHRLMVCLLCVEIRCHSLSPASRVLILVRHRRCSCVSPATGSMSQLQSSHLHQLHLYSPLPFLRTCSAILALHSVSVCLPAH